MDTTKYESWNLKKITKALEEHNVDNVKIEVPMFQRNLIWSEEQKKTFIDSVKKGFPIGTLLFYKMKDKDTYSLIDGLQRSTTIRDFMKCPTLFFETQDVDEDVLNYLFMLFNRNIDKNDFKEQMRIEIQNFVRDSDLSSSNLSYDLARMLVERYAENETFDILDKTVKAVTPCIQKFSRLYNDIAESPIPVMIFSGDESDLPTVFERINNQGTLLGKYQIYAASWAAKKHPLVVVENEEILNRIIAKYDDFVSEGYELSGYNRSVMLETKKVSVFEYVLGFGKYISDEYIRLFAKNKSVQEINQVGFELLNACFGCHNKQVKDLDEKLCQIDVNLLEKRVEEVIKDVDDILKPFIAFKSNSRGKLPLYHGQYQIISIIACVFREKYDVCNLDVERVDWKTKFKILKKTIPQHYIFDIISKVWSDGSVGKLYNALNENKYLKPIEKKIWETKLEDWFNGSLTRREKINVASPKSVEKLFLNCIFSNRITAKEQLSNEKFDIEHLATKELLKKEIKKHLWEGLPISSIGNICYLPEYDNRSKKGKTIYQDKAYLEYIKNKGITLKDIENKYTFTEISDFDWIEKVYRDEDYSLFYDNYCSFLKNRFKKMKEAFYVSLEIE